MNENTKWFSQTLLTFKDKMYMTDGYLRISISSNTEDYKFFNPPILNISITNNFQKSYNLNIQNCEDLLESFTKAMTQLNGDETIIEKKYQKNTIILFKFAIENINQTRVVVIEIISSETDSTKVIIPLKPTFQSFIRRLKAFVNNYDEICNQLFLQTIQTESIQIIHQLPTLIKGISSQIISQIPDEDTILDSPAREEIEQEAAQTIETIADLDKYLGDDMSNIKLPEIDKAETVIPIIEIDSILVEKVLRGDLFNLENKLTSFATSKQPLIDMKNDLQTFFDFPLLPALSEDDRKSLVYISTLLQNYYTKANTINDVPIPMSTPTLKYKGLYNEENIELAKDILLIIGYMRTLRRRLEAKITNAYDNKSLMYLYLRCMLDPFCFTFIEELTKKDIISSLKNRYEYFDKDGFFDKYKQMLLDNNCSGIDVTDIVTFAEEISDNIIRKTNMINVLHQESYEKGQMKLPSKNTFSLEQITNEFIPLEVNEKMGFNFKDKEALATLKDNINPSDEVLTFFIKQQKINKTINVEKITPLQRYIDKYKQDIPDQYRDEVVNHVKSMQYDVFDFDKCPWPLDEFDDRIVKAFYVWDTESDTSMKSNFTHFASMVEEEQMTKEAILISSKIEKSDGWSSISDMI